MFAPMQALMTCVRRAEVEQSVKEKLQRRAPKVTVAYFTALFVDHPTDRNWLVTSHFFKSGIKSRGLTEHLSLIDTFSGSTWSGFVSKSMEI
jgi:hypothetical protein